MKNRISKYPGRVKMTPVEGQKDVYDLSWADEAIEEGTPLNKATLLSDETAEKIWPWGAPEEPTVNQAIEEMVRQMQEGLLELRRTKANAMTTFELLQRGLI